MTTTNGANHQSVDDILASIRSSAGEQVAGQRFSSAQFTNAANVQAPATGTSLVKRDQFFTAEAADFELPAIFKPGHQSAPDKPNLLGRITDALKTPNQEPERSRTVIRFEPAAAARTGEQQRVATPVPPPRVEEPPRQAEPVPVPLQPIPDFNPGLKREMPSFFDTRLNRMGEMSRPRGSDQPQPLPNPPVPASHFEAEGGDLLHDSGMEDAAAQLLRPILKQWLSDNMPKIVEKALRSESGEDASTAFPTSVDPRKTKT